MDSIERAVERTVLASRCLDGAAEDLRALGKQGGVMGGAAVAALQDQAQRAELLAREIARIEGEVMTPHPLRSSPCEVCGCPHTGRRACGVASPCEVCGCPHTGRRACGVASMVRGGRRGARPDGGPGVVQALRRGHRRVRADGRERERRAARYLARTGGSRWRGTGGGPFPPNVLGAGVQPWLRGRAELARERPSGRYEDLRRARADVAARGDDCAAERYDERDKSDDGGRRRPLASHCVSPPGCERSGDVTSGSRAPTALVTAPVASRRRSSQSPRLAR